MDAQGLMGAAAILGIAIATIGPALAQGKTAASAMEAMARQPEAASEIRTSMVISLAFMEALTIYGLLVAILVLGKI